ncbi:MAG TPA: twin-arginine translocation signal domain-containing protein [Pyrinomonadaceae bacterium]
MTSRRKFLKQGTLGALAAGLTLGLGEKITGRTAWAASNRMLGLNRAAFASQLHTTFVIHDGTRRVPLELIEVTDLGSKKTGVGQREAFALVLRGDNATPLEQDTYAIKHEKLGVFSFLMVPIGLRNKNSLHYEININRLHG